MKKIPCKPFSVALLLAAAVAASAPEPGAAQTMTAERLESHVRYLAADAREGRFIGTPGIEEAARYIAGEFEAMGLEPPAGASYMQEFNLTLGCEVKSEPEMTIGERSMSYGEEFDVLSISGSGRMEGLTAFIVETHGDRVPLDVPRNLAGWIVFCTVDPEAERERWAMRGKDGLLAWMSAVAGEVAGLGARAVVFVNGGPDSVRSDLHHFPLDRDCEPLDIPVLEVSYAALEEALMFEGVTLERLLRAESPETGEPMERSFSLDGPICRLVVQTGPRSAATSNIIGLVRGGDRADEYVIVGAHYDHLGYGAVASSTPWRREIHNGADDNASGTAALIEVARQVAAAGGLRRSVVFIAFTAEELGALGSYHYRDNPVAPLDATVAMVNLDTVGRLENDNLIVFGARSAAEFDSLLAEVNGNYGLNIVSKKEIFGFSDQNAFVEAGIPSLHFFTGAYDDYHTPDDDWQNLNYEGLSTLVSFTADFVVALADAEAKPTPAEGLGKPPERAQTRGRGAHLGVVPDFTYAGAGVKLKGTVARSPAEAAGLLPGDVMKAVGGQVTTDLRDLMVVLSEHAPGDTVSIELERNSETILVPVVLGVRQSGDDRERRD